MREVFGDVAHGGIGAAAAEGGGAAREARELVRGRIAHHPRELLLEVGPQQQAELAVALQQLGVAAHLHRPRLQQPLGGLAGQRDEVEGAARDLGLELALGVAREPQRIAQGLEADAQSEIVHSHLQAPSAQGRAQLTRPRRRAEVAVEHVLHERSEHGSGVGQ